MILISNLKLRTIFSIMKQKMLGITQVKTNLLKSCKKKTYPLLLAGENEEDKQKSNSFLKVEHTDGCVIMLEI